MLFPTPPTLPGIEICQHISLYAPLSCTVQQPISRATVPVATTTILLLLLAAAAAIIVLLTLIQI